MSKEDRLARLMPNGIPRYVRCYDNGGETFDRYTVVFTGNYRGPFKDFEHRYERLGSLHVSMSPQFCEPSVCIHDESDFPIDRPTYGHLGKKIAFTQLPHDCQKLVLDDYKEIWSIG